MSQIIALSFLATLLAARISAAQSGAPLRVGIVSLVHGHVHRTLDVFA